MLVIKNIVVYVNITCICEHGFQYKHNVITLKNKVCQLTGLLLSHTTMQDLLVWQQQHVISIQLGFDCSNEEIWRKDM
jgi:hypothetical protein